MAAANPQAAPVDVSLEPSPVAVRLEAVKLAHRFDRAPDQVLVDAAIYADWVLGTPPRRGKSDKSAAAEPGGT